jgi:hypothetical protein
MRLQLISKTLSRRPVPMLEVLVAILTKSAPQNILDDNNFLVNSGVCRITNDQAEREGEAVRLRHKYLSCQN